MRKAVRILLFVMLGLVILSVVLIAPVDWTPYGQTAYHAKTLRALDSVARVLGGQSENDTVRIGWAEANITPREPVTLTAYGMRGDYKAVHDSAMVKAIVFTTGHRRVAFITYDLWMLHPHLAGRIKEALQASGLALDGSYFSATHTHNGFGGWLPGLAGHFIAGDYQEEVVQLVADQTVQAVSAAIRQAEVGTLGYAAYSAEALVKNRLVQDGPTDPWLRMLKMTHAATGETAVLTTFSAHATFMSSKERKLASDYPAPFLHELKGIDSVQFAAFTAGAVGSHVPVEEGRFSYRAMGRYGRKLASGIVAGEDRVTGEVPLTLRYAELPVGMRDPHFRITDNWRLRPWLFQTLMGRQQPVINCLRVGDVVMLGLPGELSGEFYPRFAEICKRRNLHLVLTTFNGDYLGYITPDEYYGLKKYETREMNWFGPYNGAYFTELIGGILEII